MKVSLDIRLRRKSESVTDPLGQPVTSNLFMSQSHRNTLITSHEPLVQGAPLLTRISQDSGGHACRVRN